MKDKRIFAMFITSVVTLVSSLAITFGIFSTLADRALATGLDRYEFNLGGENNSLVAENGYDLSIAETIIYKPSDLVEWVNDAERPEDSTLFFDATYDGDIYWQDQAYSSRVTVIPFKITNSYNTAVEVNLQITFGEGSDETLAKYTNIKIYDFSTGTYTDYEGGKSIDLGKGNSKQYAIVIYTDSTTASAKGDVVDYNNSILLVNVNFKMLTSEVF